jgi:hypothetical protein
VSYLQCLPNLIIKTEQYLCVIVVTLFTKSLN